MPDLVSVEKAGPLPKLVKFCDRILIHQIDSADTQQQVPLYVLQKSIPRNIGRSDDQFSVIIFKSENIAFGMKPDRRILLVVETVIVQVTDKVWKPVHHLPENLQGLNVCKVLIGRRDEPSKYTPCKCCLNIFQQQNQASLLDKAYRETEAVTSAKRLPYSIQESLF